MVHPAVPASALILENLIRLAAERDSVDAPFYEPCDGTWVVECSEWVLDSVELTVCEQLPDIVSEARPD